MTRHPAKAHPTGLPHDLCFMRRSPFTLPGKILWRFRSEGDLARINAPTYTLSLLIPERIWIGTADLLQVKPFELSPMQVDVLRSLLPPDEVAFVTALTLGIGQ